MVTNAFSKVATFIEQHRIRKCEVWWKPKRSRKFLFCLGDWHTYRNHENYSV